MGGGCGVCAPAGAAHAATAAASRPVAILPGEVIASFASAVHRETFGEDRVAHVLLIRGENLPADSSAHADLPAAALCVGPASVLSADEYFSVAYFDGQLQGGARRRPGDDFATILDVEDAEMARAPEHWVFRRNVERIARDGYVAKISCDAICVRTN